MKAVPKKIVVDEQGKPLEVILSWSAFCEIAEEFGWDLDDETKAGLRGARRDFETGQDQAFVPLSSL